MNDPQSSNLRRTLVMTMLVAAGECVFLLPFVVARIFRPTFLDVFQLSNFELGSAFSLYGVVAIAAYFFGGPLADRFSARKLMAVALLTTSVGGIVMSSVPSLTILTILYGFWGLTTILLFWAALIKATRQWGYPDFQGRAFGILDGGRGLFAALLSSISVVIFAALLPADVESASLAERTAALSQIIWIFSIMAAVVGILIWFVIPDNDLSGTDKATRINLKDVFQVLKMPQIWLQAVIVICAYMGYKLTDYFSLYPKDAFGYDEVEAAQMGTISFWVRPFAALGAGLLADRIGSASKVTIWSFVIMMFGCLIVAFDLVAPDIWVILALTVAVTSLGVYALRGVYFALFEEGKVPLHVTGSAVGIVSVLGYTPDVFSGPLMGYLVDRSPGILGHQHLFGMVAGFALVGIIASLLFRKVTSPN